MSSLDQKIAALVKREGGYSNHPADRGGPTMYGITEQRARAHGFSGDMRELPIETAKAIYRTDYWARPGFYDVSLRSEAVADELFDTGVNMGPKTAATFLQVALNVLNRGAVDYPDVPADGDIGPLTLHALDGFRAKRGAAGETVLLKALDCLQGERYIAIALKDPKQEAFVFGWLANRVGQAL